jgi:hypothetical protein
MEQGYYVEFYARTSYVKHINTKSGTPFTIGNLSAYVYKHGYTNISFKCFDEVALELEDKQWIKGKGTLGYDISKNNSDTKKIEIVITEYVLAEKPEYVDYTKQSGKNNTYKSKKKYNEPKKDTTALEEELFSDIDVDDLPF